LSSENQPRRYEGHEEGRGRRGKRGEGRGEREDSFFLASIGEATLNCSGRRYINLPDEVTIFFALCFGDGELVFCSIY
jgi:hypothetical protein